MADESDSPLRSADPREWDKLVEALGPASLLVAIEGRMSPELRARLSPEDIRQDTLLHLWRDRERLEWRGAKSFRSLVVSMAIHRIQDAADVARAAKRGGGQMALSLDGAQDEGGARVDERHLPVRSTTPSRVAMQRERAESMQRALESLPDELRDVVRLRVFEQKALGEIAEELGLGLSAVRHRLRRGSELYAQRLRATLDSSAIPPDSGTNLGSASSP